MSSDEISPNQEVYRRGS